MKKMKLQDLERLALKRGGVLDTSGRTFNSAEAALSSTEASDSTSGSAGTAIAAALTATEAGDALSSDVTTQQGAYASIQEAGDTASSSLAAAISASLASSEAGDSASSASLSAISASAAPQEAGDSASSTALDVVTATVSKQEAGDSTSSAATEIIAAAMSSVDAGDDFVSTVKASLGLSAQHAGWLESIARLHGLIDPLIITPTSRGDGTVIQARTGVGTPSQTVETIMAPSGDPGPSALDDDQATWLERLARAHGLIDPLTSTGATLDDGTLHQSTTVSGTTITVALT